MLYKLDIKKRSLHCPAQQQGFTLVELIMGIVVLAIALSLLSSLIFPRASQSLEPLQQMRGAELAQSLMNEINAHAFDEHSDHNGGLWRCGESIANQSIPACTHPSNYGPDDGETRANYNDVDDFHTQGQFIIPSRSDGSSLAKLYPNFTVQISISSDDSLTSLNGHHIAKRIDLNIALPSGQILPFSSYRWNY